MTQQFNTQELCGKLDEQRGFNMNTCSGLPVWPADPRPEDIRIEDIAGALSRICRYNGHLKDSVEVPACRIGEFDRLDALHEIDDDTDAIVATHFSVPIEIYSVAQHSVLVEQYVCWWIRDLWEDPYGPEANRLRLAALLHDAHEYVLGDMVKPQKLMYDKRSYFEGKWDTIIAAKFGFDVSLFDHPAIKEADYRIFLTEKRDLVVNGTTDFGVAKAEPYPERIVPVLPSAARKMFMYRFNQLYKGD